MNDDDPMFYYTRQYDEIDFIYNYNMMCRSVSPVYCYRTSIFYYYKQININDTIINELYMNNYN